MHSSILINVTMIYYKNKIEEYPKAEMTLLRAIKSQDPSVIGPISISDTGIFTSVNEGYDSYDEDAYGNLSVDWSPEDVNYKMTPALIDWIKQLNGMQFHYFNPIFLYLHYYQGKADVFATEDVLHKCIKSQSRR